MHYKTYKNILSSQNNMNIYRGCSHGCIYCDSRSKCYHIDHDFEDIEIKTNAPEMLENTLKNKRTRAMIQTGSMTDPYLPLEEKLCYTRKCLEIIAKYRFGLSILTKSTRILRDLDLLTTINQHSKCVVATTLTTYDEDLCRILEPNVSTTKERFEMLKTMHSHGIKTIVWLSPILPFINDSEENIRGLLRYCQEAKVYGVIFFGIGLTLREGNREYYYQKLDEHFPGLRQKYELYYGERYILHSPHNQRLSKIVYEECKKYNIVCDVDKIFTYLHRYESKSTQEQLQLF